MKKLLILSGKGGTGKTTMAGALIALSKASVFADCDVDAPNLHLLMPDLPEPQRTDYYGFGKAVIDETVCIRCGLCEKECRFGAIKDLVVEPSRARAAPSAWSSARYRRSRCRTTSRRA
jgi:MinD superfamily P-loop ATPase